MVVQKINSFYTPGIWNTYEKFYTSDSKLVLDEFKYCVQLVNTISTLFVDQLLKDQFKYHLLQSAPKIADDCIKAIEIHQGNEQLIDLWQSNNERITILPSDSHGKIIASP